MKSIFTLMAMAIAFQTSAQVEANGWGFCTMDVNHWGNPSVCSCEENEAYNPESGNCETNSFHGKIEKSPSLDHTSYIVKGWDGTETEVKFPVALLDKARLFAERGLSCGVYGSYQAVYTDEPFVYFSVNALELEE